MQHVFTAGNRWGPAGVLFQVGGEELETIARLGAAGLEQGADVGLACEVADRGPHRVAGGQKLQDAMAADESRSAGYQDCAHRGLARVRYCSNATRAGLLARCTKLKQR